jgi:hypothetical protein
MRIRREAQILKAKAVASLKRAVTAFNGFDDEGRASGVLRDTHHAFEMLLKAALVENRVEVFDKRFGRSFGFEKCLNVAQGRLGLSDEDAGALRAIGALRDDEQHWHAVISEGLFYTHVRAAATLFDEILQSSFGERLLDHLPHRVLPISAEPPRDVQLLIDEEFTQIAQLLEPGKRRRPEARGRIRSLLAMEAHTAEGVLISKRDVDRVERAIKAGKSRPEVFPRLDEIASEVSGEGVEVKVRFVKKGGLPVRILQSDDPTEAAAVREVDLQAKYHWSATDLATKLGLTGPRGTALRRKLAIDDVSTCRHTFRFGGMSVVRYSDNAYTRMKAGIDEFNMDEVWAEYRPGGPWSKQNDS